MSRSTSGRIVIEIDPKKKQKLHALIALEGITLKSWFIERADDYIDGAEQLGLNLANNTGDNGGRGEG